MRSFVAEQTRLMAQMVATVGAALTVREAVRFENEVNQLRAILIGSIGPGEDINAILAVMNERVLRLGTSSIYSGTQVATAMKNLAQVGLTWKEVLDAIGPTLDLAAAGNVKLADAALYVGNVLRQFNLTADQTRRVVDVLVMGANRTASNVTDLALALSYVGTEAHLAGMSLEETVAVLGMLADAGQRGSRAGTGLRIVLTQMSQREISGKFKTLSRDLNNARQVMDELSKAGTHLEIPNVGEKIRIRNPDNTLRPLRDIVLEFKRFSTGISSPGIQGALGKLFTIRGQTAFLSLMEQGTDRLDELTDALKNAGGYASEVRDIMGQGLAGAFLRLRAAASTVLGDLGRRLGGLQFVGGIITNLAQRFVALPDATKEAAAGLLQVVGGAIIMRAVFPRLVGLANLLFTTFTGPAQAAASVTFRLTTGVLNLVRAMAVGTVVRFVGGLRSLLGATTGAAGGFTYLIRVLAGGGLLTLLATPASLFLVLGGAVRSVVPGLGSLRAAWAAVSAGVGGALGQLGAAVRLIRSMGGALSLGLLTNRAGAGVVFMRLGAALSSLGGIFPALIARSRFLTGAFQLLSGTAGTAWVALRGVAGAFYVAAAGALVLARRAGGVLLDAVMRSTASMGWWRAALFAVGGLTAGMGAPLVGLGAIATSVVLPAFAALGRGAVAGFRGIVAGAVATGQGIAAAYGGIRAFAAQTVEGFRLAWYWFGQGTGVIGRVRDAIGVLYNQLPALVTPIRGAFQTLWSGIKSGASTVYSLVPSFDQVRGALVALRGGFVRLLSHLGTLATGFYNVGVSAASALGSGLQSLAGAAVTGISNLVSGLAGLASSVIGLINPIALVETAWFVMTTVATSGVNLIGLALAALAVILTGGLLLGLGAVAAGFVGAFRDGGELGEQFRATLDEIGNVLNEVSSRIFGLDEGVGVWGTLKQVALDLLRGVADWLGRNKELFVAVGMAIKTWFIDKFGTLQQIFGRVKGAFADTFDGIKNWFSGNSGMFDEWGVRIVQIVTNVIDHSRRLYEFVVESWQSIAAFLGTVIFGPIASAVAYLVGDFISVQDVLDFVAKATNDLGMTWELVTTSLAVYLSQFLDFVSYAGSYVQAVFAASWSAVEALGGALWNNLVRGLEWLVATVRASADAMLAALKNALDPSSSKSNEDVFTEVFNARLDAYKGNIREYQSYGKAAREGWKRGWESVSPERVDSDTTKNLMNDRERIWDQMQALDEKKKAEAEAKFNDLKGALGGGPGAQAPEVPAAPPAPQPAEQQPGGFPAKGGKIEMVGTEALYKKIQESLSPDGGMKIQQDIAKNTGKAVDHAQATRTATERLADGVDRLEKKLPGPAVLG